MSDDTQVLDEMRQNVEKAGQDLNNQPLMERTTVAGLLNVLRIEHEDCGIKKEKEQDSPIDVHFREACFQVTAILDEDRKRNAELREQQKKIGNARTLMELRELVQPGSDSLSPTACSPECYFSVILSRSQKKLEKYKRRKYNLGAIDLLVYINQQSTHLYPKEPWPDPTPLMQHGWRSVAFIGGGPYARVLYANENAPAFLREAVGETYFWDKGPQQGMFPLHLD